MHQFARAAFGGGTPTFLSESEIARLFEMINRHLNRPASGAPISFEMSPGTVTSAKMKLLVDHGVTRASLGIQSFLASETRALGRPQDPAAISRALDCIRNSGFRVVNLDLIYGAQNQTRASWLHSLREAMRHTPNEIYLYPLYVRPLTGLNKLLREPSDLRLDFYRQGRDFLSEQGYRQISMRLFRRAGAFVESASGPIYCCQEDGMIGFGPGARSYTSEVHYSSEYAVGRAGVQQIIEAFAKRSREEFAIADYGCVLNGEEQRRRFVIKSLLRSDGLDCSSYRGNFGSDPLLDFPELFELFEHGLALQRGDHVILTSKGIERSDTIGPWLFSTETLSRMEQYELA
jgi:oxygen-independent coproporphyrinogen-3 oxidase